MTSASNAVCSSSRAQMRDLLNHITKVTAGVSDELVDLGVDALNG